MVPVLINKDVFQPSYNDLKFMVQNFNYVCTKLISSVIYNCHNLLSFTLLVPTLSNYIPSLQSEWSSSSTSLLEILLLLPKCLRPHPGSLAHLALAPACLASPSPKFQQCQPIVHQIP